MFITCSFKDDGSGRAYTYAYRLPTEVKAGDKAIVMGPDGVEKTVTVVGVDVPEPPFECKPVLRLREAEEADSGETSHDK